MVFKKDEIVFLLGAGASIEAGIPASRGMVEKLEDLLESNREWGKYKTLYHFIKSAVAFADGIGGKFDGTSFNIERLVNTLDELRKSDEHPLFPFIGSWTPKLPEVAGDNFRKVREFRDMIVSELGHHWVPLEYDENAIYYSGLERFQREFGYPLRVFTLNYDLCVETSCRAAGVERGFGSGRTWDWRIFETEEQSDMNFFLYKLHGSIDWTRNDAGVLVYKDGNIPADKLEIIFGTTYKLQYVDPFLFLAYEFRRRTLADAKLIVCVGYSFADDHINGILAQSLNSNTERRLLVIDPGPVEQTNARVLSALGLTCDNMISIWQETAKTFLNERLSIANLASIFPEEVSPFDEVAVVAGSV